VFLDDPILAVALVAIFLLVAYPVHEFAHAWAAYMQGDATAKLFGRLTLNPIVHFDPIGGTLTAVSLLFSPILFGWAKPTPVNPSNFRDRRNGDLIVALAGPVSNLLMATLGAFVFRALDLAGVLFDLPRDVVFVLYYFVAFNVLLAIFNLLPVPPLDGSAILFRLLPAEYAWRLRPFLQQYGFIFLIGFFIVGGSYLGDLIFGVTNVLVGAG
jgi:Zn-dependent protease